MKKIKRTIHAGGFIHEEKPSDLLGGSIPFEARNLLRNWYEFLGEKVTQRLKNFDVMSCVTFAAIRTWTAQANWMLKNNLWPAESVKWFTDNGYIVDGEFRVSTRFTSFTSHTTPQGNTFQNVFDSMRNDGVVPKSKWDWIVDGTWETNFVQPPEEIIKLGQESKKHFTLFYERLTAWTPKDIDRELQQSPVVIAVPVCSPWSSNVPVCNQDPIHAVLEYDVKMEDYSQNIRDSYDPYDKNLAPGYHIYWPYKAVISPIAQAPMDPDTLFSDIKYGEKGEKVLRLKRALKRMGALDKNIKDSWYLIQEGDVYDDNVKQVVLNFQLANLPRDKWAFYYAVFWYRGELVDSATREIINNYLKIRK